MKKQLQMLGRGLLVVPAMVLGLSLFAGTVPATVSAGNCNTAGGGISGGADCAKAQGQEENLLNVFRTIVNILLFIVGAIAVIMLIIGGVRYVVSGGDQAAVTGAKNTILYAIVGIVVAFLAYAAVNFVISSLNRGGN